MVPFQYENIDSTKEVLIIEDNLKDVMLIKEYLKDTSLIKCRTSQVHSLGEAVKLLENNIFDVILMDLSLPDSKGLDSLKAVLQVDKTANIIVLTGLTSKGLGIKAISKGAQDYLIKGAFDAESLTKALHFSIERNAVLNRLEEAQRIAHLGNWELDLQSNSFTASSEAHRIFGYKPGEKLTVEKIASSIGPRGGLILEKIFMDAQEQGFIEKELRIASIDNSTRYVSVRAKWIETNNFQGFRGVVQDNTGLRSVEHRLKVSQNRYRSILNQSRDVIYISTIKGEFIDFNDATVELFGYSREELMDMHISQLYHNQKERKTFALEAKKNKFIKDFEVKLIKKDGTAIQCLISATIVKTDDFIGYHGTVRDITQQKQAERLEREKEIAEKQAVLKEKLLANISHEMRTPMNAILGMSNLMNDTSMDDEQKEYISSIKKSSEHLLGIINDILEVSTLQFGNIKFHNKNFNLHELLHNVIKVVGFRYHKKEVSLNIDIDNSTPKIVFADPLRVNQVVINLVNNAIKFTEEGSVNVSAKLLKTKAKKKFVEIQVKDTGIGIPKDKLSAIFETFVRVSDDKKKLYEGTGLGLSIVDRLVAQMNGTIEVDSEVGKGSTFTIVLPLQEVNHLAIATKKEIKKDSKNIEEEAIRILLAEDHALNQIVAVKTIKKKWPNAHVEVAENGLKALNYLEKNDVDIVLMDVQMPVMDGIEATERIRALDQPKCNTPILAMTAHANVEAEKKHLEYDMDDFVLKPFKPEELYVKIKKYINQ